MAISLAHRIKEVKPSPTLVVAAKAARMKAEGMNIISLGTGEPDFDTPQFIKEAAVKAIESGFTKYTPVDGIADLKKAIQQKFIRENDLQYHEKQIMVSAGGKQCLYNLCQALINEGDEVLIPAPFWVSYPDMVLLAGGKPVIIHGSPENRYKITAVQLAAAITEKTRLFILNSPSNPTGVAYTASELQAFAEVLKKYPQLLIVTDDLYEHIIWSQPFVNILMVCPSLYERTIVVNGVSKAFSMTGWRIGYAAGPAELIEAMTTIQSQSTSNPCSIAQKAALAALTGPLDSVKKMVAAFKERHEFLVHHLSTIQGMHIIPADGTFYLFPDIKKIIQSKGLANDLAFADQLLEKEGLALVPGSAFGQEGSIRLSFATSMEILAESVKRLTRFCNDY